MKKKFLSLTNSSILLYSLIGLILVGFGVLAYKIDLFSSGDKVEVLTSTTEVRDSDKEIVVEISGAVTKAGVYKMHLGDRIDDLLIISGGLSENADRDWVIKNINRASKLADGQKLYIYSLSETKYQTGEVSAKNINSTKEVKGLSSVTEANPSGFININTSSQSELEKLVGIGPVYAQNIIEQRPYSNTQELVSKGAISQKVFEKIKTQITL